MNSYLYNAHLSNFNFHWMIGVRKGIWDIGTLRHIQDSEGGQHFFDIGIEGEQTFSRKKWLCKIFYDDEKWEGKNIFTRLHNQTFLLGRVKLIFWFAYLSKNVHPLPDLFWFLGSPACHLILFFFYRKISIIKE